MQKNSNGRRLSYLEPSDLLALWPTSSPILYLGGQSGYAVLALSAHETNIEEFESRSVESCFLESKDRQTPFTSGYMGLLSYSDYAEVSESKARKRESRVFRVDKSLVFDQDQKTLEYFESAEIGRNENNTKQVSFDESRFMLNLLEKKTSFKPVHPPSQSIKLKAYDSDADYIDRAEKAINEIKSGRFYQINLLRFFKVTSELKRSMLLARFFEMTGPFGAVFDLTDLSLVSFSPERFVKIQREEGQIVISAHPIKGTIGRCDDIKKDLEAMEQLQKSRKDHRELNIIVDLMRNDLNRVARTGSEAVNYTGQLRSFKTVHHLVAKISAQLKTSLSLGEVFKSLCPGGSITGAPKLEVISAIHSYEQRSRGFFMGHCFYLSDTGRFDSSILIRTLVGTPDKERSEGINHLSYEYAAGSGIVIASRAQEELNEIKSKCRVLLKP